MTLSRFLPAFGVLSAAIVTACGAGSPPESEVGSVAQAVSIPKSYTRKIYAHMMPWFNVGGQHWAMNHRNPGTGIASWYKPMIGEYSSNDGNVIEYQLLMMKFAGIDGVIIDWPGLSGAYDLPQNKMNADAIIARTAAFGLQFGIVYEDYDTDPLGTGRNGGSVGAAQNDMAYVRDNFFNKSNYIQVDSKPALMVFGPQKFVGPNNTQDEGDWDAILSVFPSKPMVFPIWYNNAINNTSAGGKADGHFAWPDDKGMTSQANFDAVLDGVDEGIRIPVFFPGFNPYYQAGLEPGPTYKVSYTLKQDNTEGGNTLQSGFALGQYAGPFLQIATWNDYGEGTMIEPTDQFQYQSLTTLQQAVGTKYNDAELKIVKMLFDQRRATNGSMAAQLDQASAALANLDFNTACGILKCTVPVHTGTGGGTGGTTGAGGSPGTGGMPAAGGSFTAGGSPGAAGSQTGSAGHPNTGTGGTSTGTGGTGTAAGGTGTPGGTAAAAATDGGDSGSSGSCSVSAVGAGRTQPFALLFAASALGFVASQRRKR